MGLPLKCQACGSSAVFSTDGHITYTCADCGHVHFQEPVDDDFIERWEREQQQLFEFSERDRQRFSGGK